MAGKKFKSIGVATLKSLGAQYSSFVGIVDQVTLLHSEFESELNQVLSLWHLKATSENHSAVEDPDGLKELQVGVPQQDTYKDRDGIPPTESGTVDDVPGSNLAPWLKKLFKKIAIHCHPDKVLASSLNVTEKHRRMSSYDQARVALDDSDEPMMISIGLLYDEVADIGVAKSKKNFNSWCLWFTAVVRWQAKKCCLVMGNVRRQFAG